MNPAIATLVILSVVVFCVYAFRDMRRPDKRRIGSAAIGTVYDLMNKEKQNAIEIIVDGRAAAGDPEHRDGSPPDPDDWETYKPK